MTTPLRDRFEACVRLAEPGMARLEWMDDNTPVAVISEAKRLPETRHYLSSEWAYFQAASQPAPGDDDNTLPSVPARDGGTCPHGTNKRRGCEDCGTTTEPPPAPPRDVERRVADKVYCYVFSSPLYERGPDRRLHADQRTAAQSGKTSVVLPI